MPDSDIITRCPKCSTAFRVTPNQLAVADGSVRCGSCLAVFKAFSFQANVDNEFSPHAPTNNKNDKENQFNDVQNEIDNFSLDTDDTLYADDEENGLSLNEDIYDVDSDTRKKKTSLFDRKLGPAREPNKENADESWALDILADLENDDEPLIIKRKSSSQVVPEPPNESLSSNPISANPTATETTFDTPSEQAEDKLGSLSEQIEEDSAPSISLSPLADKPLSTLEKLKNKLSFSLFKSKEPENDDEDKFATTDNDFDDFLLSDKENDFFEDSPDDSDSNPMEYFDEPLDIEDQEEIKEKLLQLDLDTSLETEDSVEENSNKEDSFAEETDYFDADNFSFDDTEEQETIVSSTNDITYESAAESNYVDDDPFDDQTEEHLEPISSTTLISNDEIDSAISSETNYASENKGYLSGIQPAPVEIEWYESEKTQQRLWFVGAIALALLLLIQLAIFRFDTLSKDLRYRPYYASACNIFGCTLPNLENLSKIRATNLVVRSHPNQPQALIIDTILINAANYHQPYPALMLEFSDLNNQVIATRRFQPSEYLQGEVAGAKQIPANQPIQLSLSIVDPGTNATNYQLIVMKADK